MTEPPALSRRRFLTGAAGAAGVLVLGACSDDEPASSPATVPPSTTLPEPRPEPVELDADPFTLGVASGDPTGTGVVLWTRLAPEPLAGGGMPDVDVAVDWELAADEGMTEVVQHGMAVARPVHAHAVHVEVDDLEPDRWWWYRFRVGDRTSRVGRTRTMPAAGQQRATLAFAFASCQHYPTGYYTAYRHLADDDLDLVLHLGDYIYEGGPGSGPRAHEGPAVTTLAGYRDRYALYKADADLADAHARFPWAVTWDDHEVVNDYAGGTGSDSADTEAFLARRAAAYQAWWEHQPVRLPPPTRADLRIHRRVEAGDLATFHLLDQRQHRDPIPCGTLRATAGPVCDEAASSDHTMLGDDQHRWLAEGLAAAGSRWQVLAQGTVMSEVNLLAPIRPPVVNLDQWDGYPASRRRVLEAVRDTGVDAVVLSGDIHAAIVGDLTLDLADADAPVVATELVGTSITSGFPAELRPVLERLPETHPHVHWTEHERRGYVRCTVTAEELRADYRLVDTVTEPTSPIHTGSSWVVRAGRPGAERVG